MKKRILILVAVLLLSASLAFSAGEAEEKGPVALSWATYPLGEEREGLMKEMAEAYMQLHPNVNIEIEFIADALFEKLQMQFAAGSGPDLTVNQTNWVAPAAAKGMFLDLTPYFKKKKVNWNDYTVTATKDWTWKGKIYGAIMYNTSETFIFNRDLFKEAGVAPPDESWTWDNLVVDGKKFLKDKDGDEKNDVWGVALASTGIHFNTSSFIVQNGGKVLTDDYSSSAMDDPRVIEAVQFIQDLIFKHKVSPMQGSYAGLPDPFESGDVAVLYGASYMMAKFMDKLVFDWDIAMPPAGPNGDRCVNMSSNAWSVLSNTKHPEEASDFAYFLLSEEGQRYWAKGGLFSAYLPILKSDLFRDQYKGKNVDILIEAMDKYSHDFWITPDASEWWTAVNNALSVVWNGEQKDIAKAVKEAHDAINEIMSRRPPEWQGFKD